MAALRHGKKPACLLSNNFILIKGPLTPGPIFYMKDDSKQEVAQIKKQLALYNMVPNVLWSVINLVPLSLFCYSLLPLPTLYFFIGISLVPFFLPNSFIDKVQLGRTAAVYKRLGVGIVNKISQNGVIVNRLMRKKFPDYKMLYYQRTSIHKLVQQTYAFEKFHWVMAVFFVLVILFAITINYWGWALLLMVNNLLYNVYPNLLQQYIRVKLVLHQQKLRS